MVQLHLLVTFLVGWLQHEQYEVIKYLREENRVESACMSGGCGSLTTNGGAWLFWARLSVVGLSGCDNCHAGHGSPLAPAAHRGEMDLPEAPRGTAQRASGDSPPGRPDGDRESELGYTRLQGALKNVGHRVARSTIAAILKEQGIPPKGERQTSRQTFLRAHWRALVAADFFTTEVWTVRGLVTYYTVFVIELRSRRIHIAGSTPNPDEAFMLQIARDLTNATDGVLDRHRFLICDRDRKWSTAVRHLLETSGVRVVRTPFRAPNCNAHAKRFVRSIKEECLIRVIPLGEGHLRCALAEFVIHYHPERNHQGLGNELIDGAGDDQHHCGSVRRRQRLGGLLSYYYRAA